MNKLNEWIAKQPKKKYWIKVIFIENGVMVVRQLNVLIKIPAIFVGLKVGVGEAEIEVCEDEV